MKAPLPDVSQSEFDRLLDQHQHLIALMNDTELCLYSVSGSKSDEDIQALQHAAGKLVSVLRDHLFRQDQLVLPVIDALAQQEERSA